jgi:hypothetical protein
MASPHLTDFPFDPQFSFAIVFLICELKYRIYLSYTTCI